MEATGLVGEDEDVRSQGSSREFMGGEPHIWPILLGLMIVVVVGCCTFVILCCAHHGGSMAIHIRSDL